MAVGRTIDSSVTAFVGATVVPMDRERLIENQTVIVANGRITAMGDASHTTVPASARRIDARGKYLMPGLVDMHAHIPAYDPANLGRLPAVLSLLIANGVTTVRSMVGHPSHVVMRQAAARGDFLAPNFVLAAPQIAGPNAPGFFAQYALQSPSDATTRVREAKAAGFDFMKLTIALTPEVQEAVTTAARAEGLPVSGHVSPAVGLERALRSGQQIEHLDSYLEAAVAADAPAKTSVAQTSPGAIVRYVDSTRLRAAAAATRAAGVSVTPTLALFQFAFIGEAPADSILAWEDAQYFTPQSREAFATARATYLANLSMARDDRARWNQFRRAMTKALDVAGVRLLLGSDSPQQGSMLGLSVHRELAALVDAGLSPYAAFVAGTRAPAEYLGVAGEQGTVAIGKRADLVLLDRNPLENVAAFRHPQGVMLGGRWFPRAELDSMLKRAKI